jgi:hypothetical protein
VRCLLPSRPIPRALVDIRSLVFLSPRMHQSSSQASQTSRSRSLHHLAHVHNARDTPAPHHPVCTFCLHTTLRSSFPRVPPRIGNLHINPASPTQFWMRTPLFSTPILPVLPTLFRPRLELSPSTVHISCLAHPLLRLLAFFPHHPTRLHPGPPTMQTTPQLTVAPASALLVSPSAPGSPER